jgi:hypothetical protein
MAFHNASPEDAALSALPSIAIALRQRDCSSRDSAAMQLRDLVANAPASSADTLFACIVKDNDVVESAFVHALGDSELNETTHDDSPYESL